MIDTDGGNRHFLCYLSRRTYRLSHWHLKGESTVTILYYVYARLYLTEILKMSMCLKSGILYIPVSMDSTVSGLSALLLLVAFSITIQ